MMKESAYQDDKIILNVFGHNNGGKNTHETKNGYNSKKN